MRRRDFLRAGPALPALLTNPARGPSAPPTPWLDRIAGRTQRQLFHATALDGGVLRNVANWLDAWNQHGPVPDAQCGAVLGLNGAAIFYAVGDASWRDLALGERLKITDPHTGAPAVRNPFWDAQPGDQEPVAPRTAVRTLVARGVVLLLCNNTIDARVAGLAPAVGMPPAALRAKLEAELVGAPYVTPAMMMAVGQAQQAGCTYVWCG